MSDEARAEFLRAQSAAVRSLVFKLVVDDEAINFAGTVTATSNAAADFLGLTQQLLVDTIGLMCVDPFVDAGAKKWIIVSFLPDTAKPLMKMVSASSRSDIRSQLGTSFFVAEYHASNTADLTLDAVSSCYKREASEAKSEVEKQVEKERLDSGLHRGHETAAMGTVPFDCSASLTDALRSLASGSVQLVEIRVDAATETLELCSLSSSCSVDELIALLPEADPRFFVCRVDSNPDAVVLLLYCPEASKAPVKMLYATAKASFVTKLDSLSLKPGLQLQCNDAAEVRSDIAPAGDHSKETSFAKPARPGRGRARVLAPTL